MKAKNAKTARKAPRISLDDEVVADLEATDAETEAIQGGGRGQPASGIVGVTSHVGTI